MRNGQQLQGLDSPLISSAATIPQTNWRLSILVICLFTSCIAFPWCWFHFFVPPAGEGLKMDISQNVHGYAFNNAPVTPEERSTLSTTNIFNGSFVSDADSSDSRGTQLLPLTSRKPVRVFAAQWQAKAGESMAVIQHTPDICWAGTGWTALSLGQPEQVNVELLREDTNSASKDTIALPFECRVFRSPGGVVQELTLWCTLVGGQVLPEVHLFTVRSQRVMAETTKAERIDPYARRLAASHFLQLMKRRIPAQASKQFVRLSIPINESWRSALEELRTFAKEWIKVKSTEPLV